MAKFEEANLRLFKNIYVCKVCKKKIRVPTMKVLAGKAKCRRCGKRKLRVKRKK